MELDEIPYTTGATKKSKILLLLGQLSGKKKDYQKAAKLSGIEENKIKFMDYEEIKRFGAESLKGSIKYSDIIVAQFHIRLRVWVMPQVLYLR